MFEYSARPDLLKGRIILVTGAGRGIGEAAAKAYAAHGATVLLLGKNEDNLNRVYDDIEAAGHPHPASRQYAAVPVRSAEGSTCD